MRIRQCESPLSEGLIMGCGAMFSAAAVVDACRRTVETNGDSIIRDTVRVSLAWYLLAVLAMLAARRWPSEIAARLARDAWTAGWLMFVVHLAAAFHYYHGWSHADAVEHTRAVSGVGEGIYLSHLFTLAWTIDVAWWWLAPRSRARRPRFVDIWLHAYMLFIILNGTVVYEAGRIRWAGVAGFAVLAVLWFLTRPNARLAARRHSARVV